MKLIAAVEKNWGIGQGNDLLFHIPEDMRFFREKTTGEIVVMGRRTLASLPGGRPLPDRTNIVLSRSVPEDPDAGFLVCRSPADVLHAAAACPGREVYVIGGGQVYAEFLPYCDAAYITYVDMAKEHDTSMPNLDSESGWECVQESEPAWHAGIPYTFRMYANRKPASGA